MAQEVLDEERTDSDGQSVDDAFNSITGTPEMQELDARADENARGATQNAEQKPDDNQFNYPEQNSLPDAKDGKNKNKGMGTFKKAGLGGGIGLLAIFGMFSLSSFKIPSVLDTVLDATMGRVEHYVEKRAKKIFITALLKSMGVPITGTVIDGSLVGSIAKTMAANNYDKRLADKGIEIIKDSSGKGVRINLTNASPDLVEKLAKKGVIESVDGIVAALDDVPFTKNIMKAVISEDLGAWKFVLRGKISRWMRQFYGLPRFGDVKPNDSDADAARDPDSATRRLALSDAAEEASQKTKQLENLLNIAGEAAKGGNAPTSEAAEQAARDAVREAVQEATGSANTDLAKADSGTIKKIMAKIAENISKTVLGKLALKAVPIYGEVVLAAQIKVLSSWLLKNFANGEAFRAIGAIKGLAMGFQFAKWSGIASDIKLGNHDPDSLDYRTSLLDNLETSSLHNCIDTDWKANCASVGSPVEYKLDETSPEWFKVMTKQFEDTFKIPLSSAAQFLEVEPAYQISKFIVKIDSWIGETFMSFLSLAVPPPLKDGLAEKVGEIIKQAGDIMTEVAGLAINPFGGGEKLFNILVGGGVASANRYAAGLDMNPVSLATAALQNQSFLAEQKEYIKSKGLVYALFSPEVTSSVTSRLARGTSISGGALGIVGSAASLVGGLVGKTPRSLAGIFSESASAAGSATTPEAVLNAVPYGLTEAQLGAPVSEAVTGNKTCPDTNTANPNTIAQKAINPEPTCKIDVVVAEGMACSIDDTARETAKCNPDADSGGGGSAAPPAGGGGSATASGFAWPLGQAHWNTDKADYISVHAISGSRFYANATYNILGAASDVSRVSLRQPVYAMYGGTVRETNPGGQGGLSIESEIAGKKMIIVYAHGLDVNLKKGDAVTTGQKIMGIGSVGNSTGPHLHIQLEYAGVPRCIQDLFVAMNKGPTVDLGSFPQATPGCPGRRL